MDSQDDDIKGLLTTVQLSQLTARSDERIRQLIKKNVITLYKRVKGDYYFFPQAMRQFVEYQDKLLDEAKKTAPLADKKMRAEIRYKTAKAKSAEIAVKETEGKYHKTEDVQVLYTAIVSTSRNAIEAIPARTGALVYGAKSVNEAQTIIENECNQVLKELASLDYNSEQFKQTMENIRRERQGREVISEQETYGDDKDDDENDMDTAE